jgi:outer membrane protein
LKTLKINKVIVAGALLLSGAMASAEYKVGVVQAVRVLESAPQAEIAKKKLETEFAGRDKQLLNDQKALKALEDRLGKDAAIMSETERTRLERDIVAKRRDIKRNSDEFREDVNFRRNEEFGKIQRQIVEAIRQLADEEKYDLVLGEGVIYASKAVDITDKVIERLKKNNP